MFYPLKWLMAALLIYSIFAVGCGGQGNGSGGLSISITHSGTFAAATNTSFLNITISNGGSAATQAVMTLSDTLSNGLYFIAGGGDSGWTCSATNNNQSVTCTDTNAILAGASSKVFLQVGVGAVLPGAVSNTATVSSGGNSSSDRHGVREQLRKRVGQ
jgi:hypothetical protein